MQQQRLIRKDFAGETCTFCAATAILGRRDLYFLRGAQDEGEQHEAPVRERDEQPPAAQHLQCQVP